MDKVFKVVNNHKAMTTPRSGQYEFIKYVKMFRWPYSPDAEKIKKIRTPKGWGKVTSELSDFLESGKELNFNGGKLLMKMKGVYVLSDDSENPAKIRNRERCRYKVIDDAFSILEKEKRNRPNDRTILVLNVFPTMDAVEASLRREWGLGYEQRIVDKWNEDRIVGTRPGFYQ